MAPARPSPPPRRPGLAVFGAVAFAVVAALLAGVGAATGSAQEAPAAPAPPARPADAMDNGTCVTCHAGIEDMHPFSPVTCVQCHGGDATQMEKEKAHVERRTRPPGDERTLGRTFDLEYTRFQDPGNLRVAEQSCGPCHPKAVYDTLHSLHSSTAGHLGDGLYENGVVDKRHPPVAVFPLKDDLPEDVARPPGAVSSLRQIPAARRGGDEDSVARHFSDLPRKACMQCHLWSRGRAVRGRAGMDGDYRGEGCSACHVVYADDGLTRSRDATVNRFEPGHPLRHEMVRFPPTDVCARCHYGDASIGLSFRGLAQPVPGMPQTPDAPGLHKKRLNGVYYIDDPAATPADVHHQRGMHCVDCHTREDTMGDGFLYTRMEDAVGIRCEVCHGTPDAYATGVDKRGNKLPHVERRRDGTFLKSRVTGKLHRIKQARDVVRPGSKDFNPRAALAMTGDHGRLECYACHSGWNPNFFGFHFDRNEGFEQLDILSGRYTPGRVTTQEKVFSTFKQFYLGWNSHGRIAPYMVGFSTMATVHDAEGRLLLDQALPETSAGLSGMTMIHHQTHTTTARARQCVECHRAPGTFGRGSVNFRLTRDFLFAAGAQGVRAFSLDRKTPGDTTLLSSAGIDNVRALAVARHRNQGHAEFVYAASPDEGLVVVDVRRPGFPEIVQRDDEAVGDGTERMRVVDDLLIVADGADGLRFFDISKRDRPRATTHLADLPAFDAFLDGVSLFVPSGDRGLSVVDLSDPATPRVTLRSHSVVGKETGSAPLRRIETLFQYSRPNPTELEGRRSRPRNLAAVAADRGGLFLLDVTNPTRPTTLARMPPNGQGARVADVALGTIYELGSEGGAIATAERDYVFAVGDLMGGNRLSLIDVTDPTRPELRSSVPTAAGTRAVQVLRVYNPPFLQTFVLTAHAAGIQLFDVSRPSAPTLLAAVNQAVQAMDLAVEEFPLDRTVDLRGAPVMDVSHEGARWLSHEEFLRALRMPVLDVEEPATDRRGDEK